MAARIEAGIATRPEAAAMFSMPTSTYESHENGIRATKGIPVDNARMYARRYKVSLAWLLTGQGSQRSTAAIEIRGMIGAGAEVEDYGEEPRFEDLGVNLTPADDYEWYEVRGDSMEPRVFAGEFIAFEKKHFKPKDLLRQACLVSLENGHRFFKIMRPGSEPGLYDLASFNDKLRPDQQVKHVARVALIVTREHGRKQLLKQIKQQER